MSTLTKTLSNTKECFIEASYAGELEGGADTVEYTIILMIVVAIGVVLFALRDAIVDFVENATTQIQTWAAFS